MRVFVLTTEPRRPAEPDINDQAKPISQSFLNFSRKIHLQSKSDLSYLMSELGDVPLVGMLMFLTFVCPFAPLCICLLTTGNL